MSMPRSTWIVFALFAVALATPAVALACACCDGRIERTPVGWSAPGDSLLVRETGFSACEEVSRLLVWQAGRDAPMSATEKTVDLFAGPVERIPAERLRRGTAPSSGSKAIGRVRTGRRP